MTKTLWIIAAYFLFQAVIGALSRQAKKKQQQGPHERTGRPEPTVGGPPDSQDTPREEPVRRQTPEDIAAEIRRMMGLERAESSVEVIEEVYEPPVASSAFAFDVEPNAEPNAEPSHGGDLRDRLRAKGLKDPDPGTLTRRPRQSSLASRFAGSGMGGQEVRGFARHRRAMVSRGSAYLDLSDVARALVTGDILGPPKALRDDF